MSGKLSSSAFVALIDENIEWVRASEDQGVVSEHIIECLKDTVLHHYGKTYDEVKKQFN